MCLVAVIWQADPVWPLILLGNRDEYHARPSAAAAWWPHPGHVLGGRDLRGGGSWLAVSRSGRFAVVTNHPARKQGRRADSSRGTLVAEFAAADTDPLKLLRSMQARAGDFAGFSLLAGTPEQPWLLSSPAADDGLRPLEPGVFALTNSPPEQPWPKARWLEAELGERSGSPAGRDPATLLALLAEHGPVGARHEGLAVSPPDLPNRPFVRGPEYGTRASTVLRLGADGSADFLERRFGPDGAVAGETRIRFRYQAPGSGEPPGNA